MSKVKADKQSPKDSPKAENSENESVRVSFKNLQCQRKLFKIKYI